MPRTQTCIRYASHFWSNDVDDSAQSTIDDAQKCVLSEHDGFIYIPSGDMAPYKDKLLIRDLLGDRRGNAQRPFEILGNDRDLPKKRTERETERAQTAAARESSVPRVKKSGTNIQSVPVSHCH